MDKRVNKEEIEMPLAAGTELQLSVMYNPNLSLADTCKLQIDFEMGNPSENRLFHVKFVIHEGKDELRLVQSSKENGKWINCAPELQKIHIDNLVVGKNSLRIVVGPEEFEVYINDKRYNSCVSTARLQQFTAIILDRAKSACFLPIPDTIQLQNKGC